MAGGPLEGVRIVDLTSVVVGPLATQIMADHGADVIKVEAPGGDIVRTLAGRGRTPAMSGKFLHLNRNKRSLVLDLKKPGGRDALLRLLATADVLIWNMRPPAMARSPAPCPVAPGGWAGPRPRYSGQRRSASRRWWRPRPCASGS